MEIGHMKSFGIQSDLDEIKRLSKCFLYLEPEETQFSPMLVHHPFTSSGFVGLRDDAGDVQIGNILEKEDDRARWQKQLVSFINIEPLLEEYNTSYFREMLRDWGKY